MSFETYLKRQMLLQTVAISGSPCLVALMTDANTEVTGGGYSRQPVALTVGFDEPIQATNALSITWPVASSSWGVITHIGLYDPSGAHLLARRELLVPQAIPAFYIFTIPSYTLEIGFV